MSEFGSGMSVRQPNSGAGGEPIEGFGGRRQRRRLGADPPGIIGLRKVIVSGSSLPMPNNSSNSSWGVGVVACARVSALPVVSAAASSSAAAPASPAVVAHARSTIMHGAVNSWSDRVPRKDEYQRWGFRSGRRFAPCQRWRQG